MDGIVGVRFETAGPIAFCGPGDLDLGIGDYVVVRTTQGERLGWIVLTPDQVVNDPPEGPVRVIDRHSDESDVEADKAPQRRAEEDIGRALAIAPTHPEALLERGNIRRLRGDREGARKDWLRVITAGPAALEAAAARLNLERMDLKQRRGRGSASGPK